MRELWKTGYELKSLKCVELICYTDVMTSNWINEYCEQKAIKF